MDFKNKKVLVSGASKSGIASALLIIKLGAKVTLQDIKDIDGCNLPKDFLSSCENNVDLLLGENPTEEILKTMDLLVLSPGIPTNLPFIVKARELNLPIYGEVELGSSIIKAPILAITGTNGKTTTTSLTGEICNGVYEDVEVVGNIGLPVTSKALSIKDNSVVVAEISSFQLETIHDFKPRVSAILNLTPDHLDRHKTFENYSDIKKRICENQDENDYLVLNYDDENCRKIGEEVHNSKNNVNIVYFSRITQLDEGFYVKNSSVHMNYNGKICDIIGLSEIPIIGEHNVENVLASSAISILAGIPVDVTRRKIKEFKGVSHRLEFVRDLNGVKFYNDSKATNPDAAIKAINSIKSDSPKIVLIGGGYEKNSDFSEWVSFFSSKVKYLILMGEVADKIAEVCKAHDFTNFEKVNSLKDAVTLGYSKCKEGDYMLLSPACASWDMFDDFEQRGNLFKEFVNEL